MAIFSIIQTHVPVNQFLSGVFLLIPKDYGEQLNIECSTEDEQFRDMSDAILEIRAFDTTWFMLYTNDRKIIDELKNGLREKYW